MSQVGDGVATRGSDPIAATRPSELQHPVAAFAAQSEPQPRAVVDIIIVNWNAGSHLRECLESIARAGNSGALILRRILVVDNASSDGSADGLEDVPLPLTVIRNDTNRGFAPACNQAAAGSDADFVLFLNPDTRLLPDSVSRAVRAMLAPENKAIGIVGIQLLDAKGNVTPTCARFLTPAMVARRIVGLDRLTRSPWLPHFMIDWDHRTSATVDHVMGAFYLVRREVFERLGGMDERFFLYLEDLDFSLRARQSGFGTLYLTDAQAYHKGGGSSEQIKGKSLFYSLSSRILYGYKHFGPWAATLLMLGTVLVEPFARVLFAVTRRSRAQLFGTVEAYALLWRWLLRILPMAIRRGLP